jgi:hypothetical protein
MKRLGLLLTLAAVSSIWLINCAQEGKVVGPGGASSVTVPQGKTYVVLNAKRKEVARYTAGQALSIVDCAKIPCPPTFPADYVCWDCKARPEETPSATPVKSR